MSGMLDSRSYNALAMLVSSSDGRCLDGLVAAILLSAAMIAVVVIWRVGREVEERMGVGVDFVGSGSLGLAEGWETLIGWIFWRSN